LGNTTRRQPISTRIPASPDYRFLNITDFKGLDISDNPFILKPNTASDLLNVYVDENNALSTRPRLEKLYDAKQAIADGELISVYNISNGYLIHIRDVEEDSGVLYKYTDRLYGIYGVRIPTNKCLVYEKGDKIYLLDGFDQYVIDGLQISSVLPYVPTIRQASLENRTGGSYEQTNILSNEYKETYFWDDFTLPFSDTENVISVENKSYTCKKLRITPVEYTPFVYNNGEWLVIDPTTLVIYHGVFNKNHDSVELVSTGTAIPSGFKKVIPAKDALSFFVLGDEDVQNAHYSFKGGVLTKTQLTFNYGNILNLVSDLWCSSDGDCLFLSMGSTIYYHSIKKNKNATNAIPVGSFLGADIIDGVLYFGTDLARFGVVKDFYNNYDGAWVGSLDDLYFLPHNKTNNIDVFGKFKNGIYVCDSENGNGAYIEFDENNKISKLIYNNVENVEHTQISDKGIIGIDYDKKDLVVSYINNDKFYSYEAGFVFPETPEKPPSGRSIKFDYDYINDLFLIGNGISYNSFFVCTKNNTTEPTFTVQKRWSGKTLDDLVQMRSKFLKSSLVTRFENNWWFASDNTLFRTENNDPTYVPLDEEMEIGDTKDVITGFNLAQDDLLVVYKKNKIFAIQPAEVYDRLTYTILETKNVSGNNAFGSAIVTTLTETPVHISYDGIFALNQLKNVQSSDRVAMLISDKINKKWLKESKSAIDNCKTINRLYWTYFVLMYKGLTKIYLLDNRTQSWFYWELPIETLDVFVKDETATFVDVNGKIYKLTTDDIINEYNKDVTEYYDDDKKLIKWYWKSQILPLGTINYSKKLVDTTFIVADTDASDEYALNYKFRAYRKMVSESNETTISNRLNYVQSTTKKTLIPRFNFLQTEIYNVEDDLNNNKLRLLGLGLKYVLLEGLL
jgi:hypothetical protein